MKWYRILAVARRYFSVTFCTLSRVFNIFYWPFINIVVWGITSVWIQQFSSQPQITQSILTGLVLWQIVFRVNLETAKGVFEELVHQNIVNLFSSPLTWSEWVSALMIIGTLHMALVTLVSSALVKILYNVNMLALGWSLIPFMTLLLMSGWFIGFFICGLLIYGGLKTQDYIYTIGYLFAPFSAIYYPVTALPKNAQLIASWLPTTSIFEAMREVLHTGTYSPELLVKSLLLNAVYLVLSLGFFYAMFELRRERGLGQKD